jgi:hypothetical protein
VHPKLEGGLVQLRLHFQFDLVYFVAQLSQVDELSVVLANLGLGRLLAPSSLALSSLLLLDVYSLDD